MEKKVLSYMPVNNIDYGGWIEESDINKLIRNTYMSYSGGSELTARLLKVSPCLPSVGMALFATQTWGSSVVEKLELKLCLDESRLSAEKVGKMKEVVKEYFQEIGFNDLVATDYESMRILLARLEEDVPQVRFYFDFC